MGGFGTGYILQLTRSDLLEEGCWSSLFILCVQLQPLSPLYLVAACGSQFLLLCPATAHSSAKWQHCHQLSWGSKSSILTWPPWGCKHVLSEKFHTATTLNKSPALLLISLFFLKKKIVVYSFHLQNSAGIFFEGSFRLYNMTSFCPFLSPSQTLSSTPLTGERE